jgi:hypothetical protein
MNMSNFSEKQRVTIARDNGRDYGYMLGRTGTVILKCMKRKGQQFYQVKVGRDVVDVWVADLDAV